MMPAIRNNEIGEGVVAFSIWLRMQEKGPAFSRAALISTIEFVPGRLVVMHDNLIQRDVTVEISNGIPFCKECEMNDCAHVGFAVCTAQLHRRSALM